MEAQRASRLLIGPEMPYAVFTVAGVTYSYSAPTVSLMPFTADELATLEIDPDSLVAVNNTVVPTPAREVRFVAEHGWIDLSPCPTPERPRDPRGPVEFAYHVFESLGADGVEWARRGGWLPLLPGVAPNNTVVRKPRVRKPRRKPALCGV